MTPTVLVALALSSVEAPDAYHPWYRSPAGPLELDLSKPRPIRRAPEPAGLRFEDLDRIAVSSESRDAPRARDEPRGGLLPPWVQRGDVVLPVEVALGLKDVDPIPPAAFEDIPGNKYPRKHTLYLNFVGAELVRDFAGTDNSAINTSILAKNGPYPAFTGGETLAIAVAQAVENDLAPYGVRVVYLERPDPILPYTMAMMGGTWQDTNLDAPAGGVAPTADCGALNQRHIVYVFTEGTISASSMANVASQEAGHAWGLDHTLNCDSVMSYCGGISDSSFSTTCDPLCAEQCQGANTIGCRLNHEVFCEEGSEAQNEDLELSFLFGGDEPDLEPPYVDIVEPEDGLVVDEGADVAFRADIDDDYGGMGWKVTIEKDGEVLFDEIDYYKNYLNTDYQAALNLTKLAAGRYTITVIAMDHADHVTQDSVTFTVGAQGTSGEDESSTGLPMDTDSSSEDGTATDTDAATSPTGGDEGCGCTSADRRGVGLALCVLVLASTGRRRRPFGLW